MSRPAWVEELPPDRFHLVRDHHLVLVVEPTRWEWVLEHLALWCWETEWVKLGDWFDRRRSDRQWERARREVGCST